MRIAFIVTVIALLASGALAAPATAPATQPVRHLALRRGAPMNVQAWFSRRDKWREQGAVYYQHRLEETEQALKEYLSKPTPQRQTAHTRHGDINTSDPNNEIEVHRQAEAYRALIASFKKLVKRARTDPLFIYMPSLPNDIELNAYGTVGPILVVQITGDTDFIGRILNAKKLVWFAGFSMKGVVDGALIHFEEPVYVTGTRRYQTATATNTVFQVEQFNVFDWVYEADGPE